MFAKINLLSNFPMDSTSLRAVCMSIKKAAKKLREFVFFWQMLLEEKADALREEAEEMTTAPELHTAEQT